MTSVIFLLTILGVVVFLTITKKDRIEDRIEVEHRRSPEAETASEAARVLVVANKTIGDPRARRRGA